MELDRNKAQREREAMEMGLRAIHKAEGTHRQGPAVAQPRAAATMGMGKQ